MAGKKKAKPSSASQVASSSKNSSKKSTRSTTATGKQSNANTANAKTSTEGDAVTYGVVPSEYNIQAQIDWLTAPPTTGDKKSAANTQAAPSKKPQRGYHHDLCDGCGEGECLMYCDKCPAAYHCICDDPPLPPEDYESIGVNWKCKRCRNSVKIKTEPDTDAPEEIECPSGDGPIKNVFRQLIPLAQSQNPVQFKLPKEYPAYDYPFPGTSRHVLKKARQRTSVIEVENGIVPKPTVLCFHCQISCRIGALIQCDKCDLFFHLDCLDPPLTTIPTTVWICPLHVEPLLESKQLTSIALSERIKIWEKGDVPVNRPAVILDFLKKARKPNPMFRRKQPIPMLSNSSKIPEMVETCYKDTVEVVQERFGCLNALAYVCEMEKANFDMKQQVDQYRAKLYNEYLPAGKSLVEQRAKLDYLRSRNELKMEHLKNLSEAIRESTNHLPKSCSSGSGSATDAPRFLDALNDVLQGINARSQNRVNNGTNVSTPTLIETEKTTAIETKTSGPSVVIMAKIKAEPLSGVENEVNNKICQLEGESAPKWLWDELKAADADINEDMKTLNELSRDVRKAGEILMEQSKLKPDPAPNDIPWKIDSNDFISNDNPNRPIAEVPKSTTNCNGQTQNAQSTISEACLRKLRGKASPLPIDIIKGLPRKVVNKLAACHLRNMLKRKAMKESLKLSKTKIQPINIEDKTNKSTCELVLKIENSGRSVKITKRVFSVGSGVTCDFKLTDFVKCNRIEDVHAKIFFNPLEDCYEILNYSSYGISVNKVKFGLGNSNPTPMKITGPSSERLQDLEKILDKRIDAYIKLHPEKMRTTDNITCVCKPFPGKILPSVYEGSVKLYAGNRLEIGCAKLLIERFGYPTL